MKYQSFVILSSSILDRILGRNWSGPWSWSLQVGPAFKTRWPCSWGAEVRRRICGAGGGSAEPGGSTCTERLRPRGKKNGRFSMAVLEERPTWAT